MFPHSENHASLTRRSLNSLPLVTPVNLMVTELVVSLVWLEGAWRATDVEVDGVSLAKTWEDRFERLYRNRGVPGVDEQMAIIARRYPPLQRP